MLSVILNGPVLQTKISKQLILIIKMLIALDPWGRRLEDQVWAMFSDSVPAISSSELALMSSMTMPFRMQLRSSNRL